MKTYFDFCRILPLAALCVMAVSCDNDDDSAPQTPPADKNMIGQYEGTVAMRYVVPQEDEGQAPEEIAVEASITAKYLGFEEFPVATIVEAIVGEENAVAIIEQIGIISYQVDYTAKENEKSDALDLEFTPEPLEITLPGATEEENIVVTVSIVAVDNGTYAYSGKTLNFALGIEQILVGEVPLDQITDFSLIFELNKK